MTTCVEIFEAQVFVEQLQLESEGFLARKLSHA